MICVGIGGWTYDDWRGSFYPPGLAQRRELDYASRKLGSIEINGTYYGTQKPESFLRWHDETPEDFVFALKGPRFATNRRNLAEAGGAVERFFSSGVMALKDKLGPVNWQLMPTKKFDAEEMEGFLGLLPRTIDGRAIRHAVEVRHDSFRTQAFIGLARKYGIAVVVAGDSRYPQIADVTAPFIYARIMGTSEAEPCGYSAEALELWGRRARAWAGGLVPEGLEAVGPQEADHVERDVFLYVISGFKARNPAAAMALIGRLQD